MTHKFVNIHELISHNPSCLNRDDMNMQKSALFGGVRRIRISSQCLKRAYRSSEAYKKFAKSVRTGSYENMRAYLKANFSDINENVLEYVLRAAMPKEKVITAWTEGEAEALIKTVESVLADNGLDADILAELLPSDEAEEETEETEEKGTKKKKQKKLSKEAEDLGKKLSKAIEITEEAFIKSGISSVDVALSGRMCASGVLENVEAAMSVAHAITTHSMETEIDWFTAMDDLKEDTGAGHLNTQEFGAGVFYQYASIDVDLLAQNMGTDRKEALAVISAWLRIMATVTPSGKQHTFASHSLAHSVMVSMSDMPLSLANAFENPIKKDREGYVKASAYAMLDYWSKLNNAYEIDEKAAIFALDGCPKCSDKISKFKTLRELQSWVEEDN